MDVLAANWGGRIGCLGLVAFSQNLSAPIVPRCFPAVLSAAINPE
jgi:hypothetical protein